MATCDLLPGVTIHHRSLTADAQQTAHALVVNTNNRLDILTSHSLLHDSQESPSILAFLCTFSPFAKMREVHAILSTIAISSIFHALNEALILSKVAEDASLIFLLLGRCIVGAASMAIH